MSPAARGLPEVKICGVCSPADAAFASRAGAAYVGVILAPGRQRSLTLEDAAAVLSAATARRVGVFVDAPPAHVVEAAELLRLDVVQLHGSESRTVAALLGAQTQARVWKAVSVRSAADVELAGAEFAGAADGLLLDGWSPGAQGGAGVSFDWAAVAAARLALPAELVVIVAGGLDAANVAGVVSQLRPDVVDVSSGVESSLRHKSAARVKAFVEAARGAAQAEG